jgi:endonuclease/exonuclease/phosphatase family metal-dependent hydrolase
MSRGKKIKLRTASDVISRLRWSEAGEDCGRILIGYEDRIKGPMEKSIADFKSMDEGGDIPQHRIHYFRRVAPQEAVVTASDMNQLILWGREDRIDRIFGSGVGRETPASDDTIRLCFAAIVNMQHIAEEKEIRRLEKAKQRERRQLRAGKNLSVVGSGSDKNESATSSGDRHQWSNGDWFAFSIKNLAWNKGVSNPGLTKLPPTKLPTRLRCVTWNVLFDEYGAETSLFDGDNPRDRWAQAIKMLAEAEADLIALQEVTPEFVELLCQSLWVQEGYAVSASPGDCTSVEPFGNLLLWKREALEVEYPSLAVLSDGKRKRSVTACLRSTADPETVFICASVHLPCDATGADAERQSRATARRRELNAVIAKLQFMEQQVQLSATSIVPIVMGDFNTDSKDLELEKLLEGFFVDIWSIVSNGREGFTYDPVQNKRASHSLRGRRRIDRVFAGLGAGEYPFPLTPTDGGLIGASSDVEGYYPPSDHYGLSISFGWEMNSQFKGANRRLASHNAWAATAIPTTDTLLALTLGESNEAQSKLFDPNSSLPVPHITFLNGFAEMLSLESRELASKVVAAAVASILEASPSYEVTFSADSLTVFEHRQSASLVCKPDADCHWLQALYNTLRAAFRFCDEQERRFENGWSPHGKHNVS